MRLPTLPTLLLITLGAHIAFLTPTTHASGSCNLKTLPTPESSAPWPFTNYYLPRSRTIFFDASYVNQANLFVTVYDPSTYEFSGIMEIANLRQSTGYVSYK